MSARRWRPRLWTVFLAVSVVILLLPLVGAWGLRVYQSVLVRRTEGDLLAQGALVAALYRRELAEARGPAPHEDAAAAQGFEPLGAELDLASDAVLPPPPDGEPAAPSEPAALEAGARVSAVLAEAQRVTLTGVRVLDRRGVVVGTSGADLGLSLASREEVLGALEGRVERRLRERTPDPLHAELSPPSRRSPLRVWVALPVRQDGRVEGAVLLARTPQDVVEALHGHRALVLGGAAAVLAAVALVSALTARFVAWPVRELLARTERVAAGDLDAARPLEHAGTQEVLELSEAFARTAQALEARNRALRDFAAHVSHEFKTPLASMRGAAELLRDHGDTMTADERSRFLGLLEADADRLSRLLSGLLQLARAETSSRSAEPLPVAPVLEPLASAFGTPESPVALDVAADATSARISPEALESIARNLLENARRHAGSAARISLAVRRAGDGEVVLEVSDDGPGISEANLARLFEPFFTTARASGGTGLGLALVRALAAAHRGRVDVASRPGSTTFRVTLPG